MVADAGAAGQLTWWGERLRRLGERLDGAGRWLVAHAPAAGRAYARCLSPATPHVHVFPGWSFGREYYIERRWLPLRRGALWEFALEKNIPIPLVVRWHAGTRVEVTLADDNSLCLYVAGTFEPNEFACLDRLLRPGMTFLDVGANVGLFSLFAARRVTARGRVVAFEPSSRERAVLQRNIARNRLGNVSVVPMALGAEAGTALLQVAPGLHAGHNTLGGFAYEGVVAERTEEVQIETLDALADRLALDRIDVVKIDVEGAEVKMLQGARTTLMISRPTMLIEANEQALCKQGTSTGELVDLLLSMDYAIEIFDEATGLTRRRREGEPLSANILAVPA